MEENKKVEIYKKVNNVFLELEDCLKILEKQEDNLHKELLEIIDKEKMEKIKSKISNIGEVNF